YSLRSLYRFTRRCISWSYHPAGGRANGDDRLGACVPIPLRLCIAVARGSCELWRRLMERFLGAVVQMASGADRAAHLAPATALAREGAPPRAPLIVLPEVFAWRGTATDDPSAAEPIPGPTTTAMTA